MTSNGWNFLCIFLQTLENPVGAVGENIHKEEKRDVKGGRIGPFDAQARMRERFLKFALNADEFSLCRFVRADGNEGADDFSR